MAVVELSWLLAAGFFLSSSLSRFLVLAAWLEAELPAKKTERDASRCQIPDFTCADVRGMIHFCVLEVLVLVLSRFLCLPRLFFARTSSSVLGRRGVAWFSSRILLVNFVCWGLFFLVELY